MPRLTLSDTFHTLQADINPPVTIPDTVWMVAQFSTGLAGWVIADEAEIGSTADLLGIDQPPWACNVAFNPPTYAGFWANLRCVE